MKIPTIHGYIDRRILINFTADPKAVEKIIPFPFRPKLYKEKAIVGICLIRLKHIKPKGLPDFIGVNSENGAHRIAVECDENGETKSGVYIPRRDTSLKPQIGESKIYTIQQWLFTDKLMKQVKYSLRKH